MAEKETFKEARVCRTCGDEFSATIGTRQIYCKPSCRPSTTKEYQKIYQDEYRKLAGFKNPRLRKQVQSKWKFRIERYINEGLNMSEMARREGVSRERVRQVVNKLGFKDEYNEKVRGGIITKRDLPMMRTYAKGRKCGFCHKRKSEKEMVPTKYKSKRICRTCWNQYFKYGKKLEVKGEKT